MNCFSINFAIVLKKIIRFPLLTLIRVYQYAISPYTPASCRHWPTCSTYAIQAIERYGILKGGGLALNRILRCHPWGTSGIDPVPLFLFHRFYSNKKQSCNRLKPHKEITDSPENISE
jgi:hypothetical protein